MINRIIILLVTVASVAMSVTLMRRMSTLEHSIDAAREARLLT